MIEAFFDGCCEPVNPGGTAAYGAVILKDGVRIWETSWIFRPVKGHEGATSNNVAEYSGFQSILIYLLDQGLNEEAIIVHGDSQLVIRQMFGGGGFKKKWQIHGGHYAQIAFRCRELLKRFPRIRGEWIPREENTLADELSKAQLIKAGVQFRIQPLSDGKEDQKEDQKEEGQKAGALGI
jgi:ribonuclease HI